MSKHECPRYTTGFCGECDRTMAYVAMSGNSYGAQVQGDFQKDGVTWIDVEFPNVYFAASWLDTDNHEDDSPTFVGDLRDPVASLNALVVLTVRLADDSRIPGESDLGHNWPVSAQY